MKEKRSVKSHGLFFCSYIYIQFFLLFLLPVSIIRYIPRLSPVCSISFSLKAHQIARHRWHKPEVSDFELEVVFEVMQSEILFLWRGTGSGAERWSKHQPTWSVFSVIQLGLEPKCFDYSLYSKWWTKVQGNCQCVKWYHITNSNIRNSYVFVSPKGKPQFNWTFYPLSNRVLNYMHRHLDSAGLSPWNYVSSNVGHILIQMLIDSVL